MKTNTIARSLNDIGLAAWFGGSLMGATGLNGAAAQVDNPTQRARVANAGWARWTPVNLAAIGMFVSGGSLLAFANKGRLLTQAGVGRWSAAKTVLAVGALGATAYARVLGQRMIGAGDVPVEGGTSPAPTTPAEVANAQRQLAILQWLIPALTAAMLVVDAKLGEQQRPTNVLSGLAARVVG
ncbi:MAG: hypothetical protein JOZ99_05485 [Actinobacteria bacterium]|nr:hypothetical protein [Actinomycetota bacterium]